MLKTKSLLVSFTVLIIAFLLDVALGSVSIPIDEVIATLVGSDKASTVVYNIVLNHRLPRALAGLVAGAGLGLSGLLMQTFFRNPLAGPYVLGISAGASLGIALVVLSSGMFLLSAIDLASGISLTVAAILGSLLVFAVIIVFAGYVRDQTSLLIIGLMFSSATSAVVSILQFFSRPDEIQHYLLWTFGDLGSVSNNDIIILAPMVLISSLVCFFLVKPLNIYLLGNDYAHNAGLDLKKSRFLILVVTAVLTGTVTAYCGPIAFVGLATPHIARMVFDTSDHKILVPYTAIFGGIIMIACDLISRMPGLSLSLPLNAVTSILGGPLVIWLILNRKNLSATF